MIVDAREVESGSKLEDFDVCIVGGGAAGITSALELVERPLKVCLLESGGLDYDDDTQALYRGRVTDPAYPDIEYSRLRYFGGTTNHWSGSCRPLDAIDFKKRHWVPNSGWPFDRAHLDPYYLRAHPYCDLAEYNYDAEYWRRKSRLASFPLESSSIDLAVFQHSAPTRFGEKYRPRVEKSKNLTAYLHSNVTKIQLDPSGRHVEKLNVQVLKGKKFTVSARYYVIAMGGVENARVLLLSNDVMPNGVGNQNDLVGRYFMDHPVAKGAIFAAAVSQQALRTYLGPRSPAENVSVAIQLNSAVLEKEGLLNIKAPFVPVTRFYASEGVESLHALTRAMQGDDLRGELWDHVGNVASDYDMLLEGVFRRYLGKRLFDSADDGGFYVFDSMMETPPEPENRIRLDEERDSLGQRRVTLNYRIGDNVKENFWRTMRTIAKEFGKTGVGRLRLLENQGPRIWDDLINFGHHHMGTTRAHVQPKYGVVDGDLKVHDVSNLYIAGSSVFPTGGHVPPTLTIVALAIRLSEHLLGRLGA